MEKAEELVKRLIKLPRETEWLEFKQNNNRPEMIGEDISSLANGAVIAGKPFAYMIWGIDDATHKIVGTGFNSQQAVGGGNQEELENWLRGLLSDNVQFTFAETSIEEKSVVVLRISRATIRPVTFRREAYIRVGSYTKKLRDVPSEQMTLWDILRSDNFEVAPVRENLRSDEVIALLSTQSYFDRIHHPYPATAQNVLEYLDNANVVQMQDNGLWAITNLGALLFAKNLHDFGKLKRKVVRIVKYSGDDRLSAIKEEEYQEGYAVNFEGLVTLVNALVPSTEVIGKALREERDNYPTVALREVIANALVHQDFQISGAGPTIEIFAHRIEITNPGPLLVDPAKIIDATPKSRNEEIASLMRRMGICEELGTGWDKITDSCERAELPSAKIHSDQNGTKVTLYTKRPFSSISSEDREFACYMHACLRYTGGSYMTNASLRKRFGLGTSSSSTISKLIKNAVEKGLIRPLDTDTSRRYMKYVPQWA